MTILKCKMCGGNIQVDGETHGICDSCGCEVTLPKINDDKRADMYNRGNHFRQLGNFDKAYSAYEHIIAENSQDAEAHWCLMLCRYGIEYEKNTRSGEYIPTCSRMSKESVLDDRDYLDAVKYADEYTKDIYRREARKIADIQKRFLEISRNESPYDVFICFKDKDENGERTIGSVEAQNIYYRLEKEGVRAFFSRITLEDKIGQEYEPYIFAALNSAKVMLLVADSCEHLETRWVKNEWKRYLSMMDVDRSKKLIPVCVGMSPYGLPEEIPPVQAIEWSTIGAMETLIANVNACIGNGGAVETKIETVRRLNDNEDVIIQRVAQYMEDEDFERAESILKDYIEKNPTSAKAHLHLLYIRYNVKNLSELFKSPKADDIVADYNFQKALEYSEGKVHEGIATFAKKHHMEHTYQAAVKLYQKSQYEEAKELFSTIPQYKDSEEYVEKCIKKCMAVIEKNKKDAKISEYNHISKNATEYLRETIAAEYPKEYREYIGLYREYSKEAKTKGICCLKMPIIAMIIVLVSGLYYSIVTGSVLFAKNLMNLNLPDNVENIILPLAIAYLLSPFIFCGGIVCTFAWMSAEYEDITEMYNQGVLVILLQFVMAAFVAGIPGLILAFVYIVAPLRYVAAIIVFLVTVIHTLVCLFYIINSAIKGTRWRNAAKKCADYQKKVIAPLSENVKGNLQIEYSDISELAESHPWNTWKMTLGIEKVKL